MKYHLRISLILFVFIVLTPSSIATELQSIEAITPASTYLNIANNLYVSSSNVGIGTTSPGEKLQVSGNLRVGGADNGNYIAFRGTTGDGPGGFSHTYIGERIFSGTESSELFIFKGNDYSVSGPDRVRIGAAEFRVDTYNSYLSGAFETVASSTSLINRFIVTNTGNVGIGTTSPAQKLHVAGNTYVTGYLGVGSSNPVKTLDVRGDAYISGNVGIGTTAPAGKLEIAENGVLTATDGNLVIQHPTSGSYSSIVFPSRVNWGSDYGYIAYYDDNNAYAYWGDSAENSALIIGTQNDAANTVSDVVVLKGVAANVFDSSINYFTGSVGIGVASPADTLDVNGDVRVRGGDIKDSGGTARITFSGTNVIIRVG